MKIRKAQNKDIKELDQLLYQVQSIHHQGRPDIFKIGQKKYTDQQLLDIINNENTPVFVATIDEEVVGYAFCIFQQHLSNNILTDIKTLYIDDLCVDENIRGQHIGKSLYDYVLKFAKENSCYNVTLNVWTLNQDAMKFYEKCGLKPQKIGMEQILG